MSEGFTFYGADGAALAGFRWLPEAEPRGVVQIAHGMGEHSLRYSPLAAALNAAGLAVYANDHRGHGASAAGALGDLGPGGFAALADDMACLTRLVQQELPGVPVVLLGHSMGSFAAQLYLLDHHALVAGVALSGSAALDARPAQPGERARLQDYNAAFTPARTPFDWLSRDPAAVDAYRADPLCGVSLTQESRNSMLAAAVRMADPAALAQVPSDLPLYLFSGDADPVNGGLAWFDPLVARYRDAGFTDVTVRLYPGGRHEMLNETNREEVIADLLAWIERVIRP